MPEYDMSPDEGPAVLAARRAIEALGWQTWWDMEQDPVLGAAHWLLTANCPRGGSVECRKVVSWVELRRAVDPDELCRAKVAKGWGEVLAAVQTFSPQ